MEMDGASIATGPARDQNISRKNLSAHENVERTEYEVAPTLTGNQDHTLIPRDLFEQIARASLHSIAPCPACRGTGLTEMAPDPLGDNQKKMKIGAVSSCQMCGGSGIDPNFRRLDILDEIE